MTSQEEIRQCQQRRQGGGEWLLKLDGEVAAKGGILFHYNQPYGDIYMEVMEPYRQRGFGSYLVQELKRECYELGAIPGARCNPANIASRKTLQRAGFVPFAHILNGTIPAAQNSSPANSRNHLSGGQ
jgi:GNAT superfamily N-acetyltransferase